MYCRYMVEQQSRSGSGWRTRTITTSTTQSTSCSTKNRSVSSSVLPAPQKNRSVLSSQRPPQKTGQSCHKDLHNHHPSPCKKIPNPGQSFYHIDILLKNRSLFLSESLSPKTDQSFHHKDLYKNTVQFYHQSHLIDLLHR